MNLKLKAAVEELLPEFVEVWKQLHRNPEIGLKEYKTAAVIREVLSKYGISFETYGETGTVAVVSDEPGPVLALRADIDALPVEEKTNADFSSEHIGCMHACGHDMHTAILLGTAAALRNYNKKFHGTVKYIFQPAEENAGGAQRMIEQGVLQNPAVDHIFGLHVWPSLEAGQFAVCDGPAMAGFNSVRIRLYGKGGHISSPHLANNPIYPAVSLIQAIQTMKSQRINPLEQIVFDVSGIQAGNHTTNIIPDEVYVAASLRTYSEETTERIKAELINLLESYKKAYRIEYDLDFKYGYAPLNNEAEAAQMFRTAAGHVPGIKIVKSEPNFGSEDFGYYLQQVKGAFGFLGVGTSGCAPLHSSEFLPDEDALRRGMLIFCETVSDYFGFEKNNHSL